LGGEKKRRSGPRTSSGRIHGQKKKKNKKRQNTQHQRPKIREFQEVPKRELCNLLRKREDKNTSTTFLHKDESWAGRDKDSYQNKQNCEEWDHKGKVTTNSSLECKGETEEDEVQEEKGSVRGRSISTKGEHHISVWTIQRTELEEEKRVGKVQSHKRFFLPRKKEHRRGRLNKERRRKSLEKFSNINSLRKDYSFYKIGNKRD